MDAATFETVRRLEQAGILRFTGIEPRVLHQAEERDTARHRRALARDLCEQADHRLRMADLLAGGGFAAEAVPPAAEAAGLALRALAVALGRADPGEDMQLTERAETLAADSSLSAEYTRDIPHLTAKLAHDAVSPLDRIAAARDLLARARQATEMS